MRQICLKLHILAIFEKILYKDTQWKIILDVTSMLNMARPCPGGFRKSKSNILMAFWDIIYDRELILEKEAQTP